MCCGAVTSMWREDSGDWSDRDYWRYSEPVSSRCALLFMMSVREVFVREVGGGRDWWDLRGV